MNPVTLLDLSAQRRRLGERIERAVQRVFDHGQFILGPEVDELEGQLAGWCAGRHVVSCASGTDGLLLALLSRGVGPGDAVFVPGFTFAATAEVVALLGASPVFVDVERPTFNLDPASLEETIDDAAERGMTPRGVVAVDLFGQPADYEAISKVCESTGIWVLADAAQSFGARVDRRPVGTLAPMTVTSFFPTKPLGCYGDGGALITDDAADAELLRSLRNHGQSDRRYDHVRVGVNARMDTIQAAVLLQKLTIFGEEIERRQALAIRYNAALADVVTVPRVREGADSVWAQYTIEVDGRDQVAGRLAARGIATAVHYPLSLHRQTAYRDYPTAPGGLPVTDSLAGRVLSLPLHPYLTEAQQERVIAAVRDAVQ